MTTYVFPGQGSQTKGMGGSALFAEFNDLVKKADDILGYSIATLCLEDPNSKLNDTAYTQPALYTVNALSYLKKIKENNIKPTFVAGHSLGEYNALFAAEVFDFETGLKLVQKRGALMSQATGGGMAAVVGLKADVIDKIIKEQGLNHICIANFNSYTQSVISGPKEDIVRCESLFINAGAMLFLPLKVSGAFHSPSMTDAQKDFQQFLSQFSFAKPIIPVIANVNAKPYPSQGIEHLLAEQITHSVLWQQSISYLLGEGESQFEEVGPGKVLTGLIGRIQKGQ